MSSSAAIWFVVAGVFAITRWFQELSAPSYYAPETLADHVAVVTQTGAGIATGVALVLLWRNPLVARGAPFLLMAGLGAAAQGIGNLLEDTFDIEAAEWAFFGGGISMMLGLLIAGLLTLTVDTSMRWTGAVLIVGATGGLLGHGLWIMGLAWLTLSGWFLLRGRKTQAV